MITLIDHNKRTKSLKKKGANLSLAVREHFVDSVQLFRGEGNNNIQLINDCVDIASVTKGMRVKAAVAWFAEMIPHEQLGQNGNWHFGKKLTNSTTVGKIDGGWEVFLAENPDWYDFTVETVQAPFTTIAYCRSEAKKLNGKYEKGELTPEGFEQIKKFWSTFKLDDELINESF